MTKPVVGIAGYTDQPAVSFLDDVVKKIISKSNPWKWNAAVLPAFQTQPYQQDYPTNISQNVMGWLQSAVVVDINNATLPTPTAPMTVVRDLLPSQQVGRPSELSWIPNSQAQTDTWPGPNKTYVNPLASAGGGPSNNPKTAIKDANGNILVVTTYGVTGSVAPLAPVGAAGGTTVVDGSVVWTVQDPNGIALRLDAVATFNSIVWEIRATYQLKPPNITTLTQTVAPIPDDLSYLVKQGFLAYCYKQAGDPRFPQEYQQWLEAIQEALGASDREYQEFGFYPGQPIQGGYGSIGTHGYPGWPGWTSGS
jgi:hypothetical protein